MFLFNFMDLLPVDLLPGRRRTASASSYLKVVPTTDLNITFGMSLTVFLLIDVLSIKIKGARRLRRARCSLQPFGKNPVVMILLNSCCCA